MIRIYIIRHGITEWNELKRLQGQTDIPLAEEGRALARLTGRGMKNVHLDKCFCSPLSRARETAQLVLGERDVPVIIDPRIREISFGILEGTSFKNPAYAMPHPEKFIFMTDPEGYEAPENGEDFRMLRARCKDFLTDLPSLCRDGEQVLISTHGAASRALLAGITGAALRDFWAGCVPPNCSVTIARFEDGQWILEEKDHIYAQADEACRKEQP